MIRPPRHTLPTRARQRKRYLALKQNGRSIHTDDTLLFTTNRGKRKRGLLGTFPRLYQALDDFNLGSWEAYFYAIECGSVVAEHELDYLIPGSTLEDLLIEEGAIEEKEIDHHISLEK